MIRSIVRRTRPALLALVCAPLLGATPLPQVAPVTLVAIPWATASLNGGAPFVVPATVLLEPGEHRISLERPGYRPVETTVRVPGGSPQHHLFRLERR
jgi:hypothetical protein